MMPPPGGRNSVASIWRDEILYRLVSAFVVAMFLVTPGSAQQVPVTDFTTSVTVNAQDALTRLGYDIGASDGQWGRRSREALNALRAENGLPPADNLTGSSVALLHKLSPGPMTLPHPGMLVNDVAARRAWLMDEANAEVAKSQCPFGVGDSLPLGQLAPVEIVPTPKLTGGSVWAEDDWYSPFLGRMTAHDNRCMRGNEQACEVIIDTIGKWADVDALRLRNPRGYKVDAEIPRWISNIILRKMMASYMIARPLTPPDALQDARILDWFKRRVDQNYFMIPDDKKFSDPDSFRRQNHAMAAAQMVMMFGILSGDRSMVQPALDVRKGVLEAMREDGSIPAEARRGARWYMYSTIALGHLVAMGEWAAAQGIDTYAGDIDEEHSLQNGIRFLFDGLGDFDVAVPYAKANHGAGESSNFRVPNISGWMFAWIPAYRERFGEDALMQRLATQTVDPRMCGPDALADKEKLHDARFCSREAVPALTLADLIITQRPEPTSHMGYSAGCLQGTMTWSDLVKTASVPEEHLAELPFAVQSETAGTLPKPKFQVHGWQSQSLDEGKRINTMLGADVVGAPDGEGYVGFSIIGTYAENRKNFLMLDLQIDAEITGPTDALKACGMKINTIDDGRKFPVLSFIREDDTLVIKNTQCKLDALPKRAARMSRFILASMQDIGIGFVANGTISAITSPYVAEFIERIARGEITIVSR
jgi:hypothetical protein